MSRNIFLKLMSAVRGVSAGVNKRAPDSPQRTRVGGRSEPGNKAVERARHYFLPCLVESKTVKAALCVESLVLIFLIFC